MKKTRLIPFKFLPASWGLVGKVYAVAEASYYYDGEDLEHRLVEIEHEGNPQKLAEHHLALDLKYNRITLYDYDVKVLENKGNKDIRAKAEIEVKHGKMKQIDFERLMVKEAFKEGLDRNLALLEIDYGYSEITKFEYEKQKSILEEKPWIGIVDQGFDMEQGVNGVFFEFDWNIFWIDYLRLNGYLAKTEEEIVEQWFQDVCRATALSSKVPEEEFDLPVAGRLHRGSNRIQRDNGSFYR